MTTPAQQLTTGRFGDTVVERGIGGGLATIEQIAATSTHFHAARIDGVGDVVLAVTRTLDTSRAALARIELRAFIASAPGRGVLAALPADEMIIAPGAVAYAELHVASEGADVDERSAARLVRCHVTDGVPTPARARDVADLLATAWETELRFGSWPAVRGLLDAFDGADWAVDWLRERSHQVSSDGFLKVLVPAWLEPLAATTAPTRGDDEELEG